MTLPQKLTHIQYIVEKLPEPCGETSKSFWRNFQVILEKLPSQFGAVKCNVPSQFGNPPTHCGDPSRPFWGPLQAILGTPPTHCGDHLPVIIIYSLFVLLRYHC